MADRIKDRRVVVVGGGNAGLVTALVLRQAFSGYRITVIQSDAIGTIGVGEGSTEQWRGFMNYVGIPVAELISATGATHKKGIRFEGWNEHTPDYFHATTGICDPPMVFGFNAAYGKLISEGKLLTDHTSHPKLKENQIPSINAHQQVNQFHFDTHELNYFLRFKAEQKNITFIEGEVEDVRVSDDWIGSVGLVGQEERITGDFWIDASGFRQVLMSELSDKKWNSFSKYLLGDSAIAFPTPSDESGEIRTYTRARAMKNGWAWEIPTQFRRGNGYVYSSKFCSEEDAVSEMEELLDIRLSDYKHFRFDPGYLEKMWVGNCIAVGLAGSFVEPLEATSIGSTIQQAFMMVGGLASFRKGYVWGAREDNGQFEAIMSNILDMIRLHYISDRTDTDFWLAQQETPIPENLEHLLGLWSERPLQDTDASGAYWMFSHPHFAHVAQGQGVFNLQASQDALDAFGINDTVNDYMWNLKEQRSCPVRDHAEALKELIED